MQLRVMLYYFFKQHVSIIYFLSADIDDCSRLLQPCLNGGSCTDGINTFTCDCVTGYSGDRCEIGKYCNTRIYGGYLILVILAVKAKCAKILVSHH